MHTHIELLIDSQKSSYFCSKTVPVLVHRGITERSCVTIGARLFINFVFMYEMFWNIGYSAVSPPCFYIGKTLLSSGVIASNSRLFWMESHD